MSGKLFRGLNLFINYYIVLCHIYAFLIPSVFIQNLLFTSEMRNDLQ